MITFILVLLLSYLIGSIPTSIIAGRLTANMDIREHGSKNAGATNVYRVLGLGPAIVVAIMDIMKGAVAALLIIRIQIGDPAPVSMVILQLMAGGSAIVGHIWPVFAKFKGGKGVATTIGVLIGIIPSALTGALAVWLILLFSSRIMSVASLGAAVMLPIATWIWESNPDGSISTELMVFTSILCLLIFFTHRANIGRLLRGEELSLGRSKAGLDKTPPPPAQNATAPKITDNVSSGSIENPPETPVEENQK